MEREAGGNPDGLVPGDGGGHALARILFGEVNPSGKLPFTIPVNEATCLSLRTASMPLTMATTMVTPSLIKRALPAAFPLWLRAELHPLSPIAISRWKRATMRLPSPFDLENTGDRAGAEVAQVYIGLEQSAVDRPVKLLKGFKKVFLQPGRNSGSPSPSNTPILPGITRRKKAWEIEKMEYTAYAGGSSCPEDLLAAKFRVIGVWQVKGSCLRERGSKSLFTVYESICFLSGGWKHGKTGGTNPAAGVEQLGLLRRKCTGR